MDKKIVMKIHWFEIWFEMPYFLLDGKLLLNIKSFHGASIYKLLTYKEFISELIEEDTTLL